MSETPSRAADLSPSGLHFQILLVGTMIFLGAFFWLTWIPHTNTHDALVAAAALRLISGLQTLGCYLAFVSIIFGHRVLKSREQSDSRGGEVADPWWRTSINGEDASGQDAVRLEANK